MKIYIIIPVYNEAAFLKQTIESFVNQTYRPNKLIIINDNSTDNSQEIIDDFAANYDFISTSLNISEANHQPGSKVIRAFYKGFQAFDDNYDLIGKFDADIVLPMDYFENMIQIFASDKNIGIAGGNLYIEKKGNWIYENISEKTKVRGPIKLYRKECFKQIDGLRESVGWDSADELLASYHGWKIKTDPNLKVKHLKPTGGSYSRVSRYKQGEAFYRMRYGFLLTNIASAKLAFKKRSFVYYIYCIGGYFKAIRNKASFIVSEKEGKFIRALRWNGIKKKLL